VLVYIRFLDNRIFLFYFVELVFSFFVKITQSLMYSFSLFDIVYKVVFDGGVVVAADSSRFSIYKQIKPTRTHSSAK